MYFSTTLVALIVSIPSLISALPAEPLAPQTLAPRDDPNSKCGIALLIGITDSFSTECKYTYSRAAGGNEETVLLDDTNCDQKNINYHSGDVANMAVRPFTITQQTKECSREGDDCSPILM